MVLKRPRSRGVELMGTRMEFAGGVQIFLPEKDALVAHCHAQTISSFDALPVSRFARNWAENFFPDRIDAISVGSQELSVLDEYEINPVGFCVKMGGFWHFLASGVSCTQGKKKSDWIYLMYTSANLLVNIFNKSGWVLREIQGVHGFSSCTVT